MSPPAELPFISVVIPARNEEAYIGNCLESLGALDYPSDRFEVIIADGQSTDRTREIAESYGVRVVPNEGVSISCGRHVGFEHSKGDLIAFSDADCVMEAGWLRNAVKYFDDASVGGVAGPTLIPPGETAFGRGAGFVFSLAVAGGVSCHADTVKRVREVKDLPGANCIYRRKVIEQVMPLATEVAGSEDVEMNWRIWKNGWRLLHVSDVRLWHYKRPTPKRLAGQVYRFALGRCQCARISREMLQPAHVLVAACVPLALVAITMLAVLAPKALVYVAAAAGLGVVGLFVAAWVRTGSFLGALSAPVALGTVLVSWSVGFLQEVLFPSRRFKEYLRRITGTK